MNDQMPLIHLDQMSKVVGSKDSGDTLALKLSWREAVCRVCVHQRHHADGGNRSSPPTREASC